MPATMFFIIGNLQTRLILNVTKERPRSVIYFPSERAWFEFPNSNWYNAIQIIGLPGTAAIEMSKGKTIASSKTPAERPNTPGYVTSDLPGTVLSLLGAYDDGKSNVSISISCTEPIDLKKVQYKLLNLPF